MKPGDVIGMHSKLLRDNEIQKKKKKERRKNTEEEKGEEENSRSGLNV